SGFSSSNVGFDILNKTHNFPRGLHDLIAVLFAPLIEGISVLFLKQSCEPISPHGWTLEVMSSAVGETFNHFLFLLKILEELCMICSNGYLIPGRNQKIDFVL